MHTTTSHEIRKYGACTMRVRITRVRNIDAQVKASELRTSSRENRRAKH